LRAFAENGKRYFIAMPLSSSGAGNMGWRLARCVLDKTASDSFNEPWRGGRQLCLILTFTANLDENTNIVRRSRHTSV
jgi:hypothetical protein